MCVSQLGLWAGEERQGAVGVRGRPEDLLEGGVRLLPAGPYGGQSPDSRVLHPRQSEERHWPPAVGHHRLRNVIVIVFFFIADGKRCTVSG